MATLGHLLLSLMVKNHIGETHLTRSERVQQNGRYKCKRMPARYGLGTRRIERRIGDTDDLLRLDVNNTAAANERLPAACGIDRNALGPQTDISPVRLFMFKSPPLASTSMALLTTTVKLPF